MCTVSSATHIDPSHALLPLKGLVNDRFQDPHQGKMDINGDTIHAPFNISRDPVDEASVCTTFENAPFHALIVENILIDERQLFFLVNDNYFSRFPIVAQTSVKG